MDVSSGEIGRETLDNIQSDKFTDQVLVAYLQAVSCMNGALRALETLGALKVQHDVAVTAAKRTNVNGSFDTYPGRITAPWPIDIEAFEKALEFATSAERIRLIEPLQFVESGDLRVRLAQLQIQLEARQRYD